MITTTQIAQANCASYIAELHSVACQYVSEGEQLDNALTIIELIEDGKYLEAVQVSIIW